MLIVGLGNPHRGDDAAGILVARGLADRGIKTIQHEGSPLDLINVWQAKDCVIVIDAMSSCASPGTTHTWDASMADLPADEFRPSTHAFGLAEAIRLARMLDRLPQELTVYGIEAAHFSAGAPPSAAVLEGAQRVVDKIVSSFAERTDSP